MAIKYCSKCASGKDVTPAAQYQSEQYGHGNRVHNPKVDGRTYTCTICGTATTASASGKRKGKR